MTGVPSLGALVAAEARKLASRTSVRLSIAVMLLIAIGVPLLVLVAQGMIHVDTSAMPPPATPPGQAQVTFRPPPTIEAATAFYGVLLVRNFFVFRALIIAVVAVSFAGEFVARTLREDLVRPVSRTTVLLAKWLALQVFVAAGALVPLAIAWPLSVVLFGNTGDLDGTALAYVLTWLGDAGFATLVMAISVLLRSVPGTIGGVFLYWVLDRALGWGLLLVEKIRGFLVPIFESWKMPQLTDTVDALIAIRPWLPSYAWDVANEFQPTGPAAWRPFVALVVWTSLSLGVALLAFRRVDVD